MTSCKTYGQRTLDNGRGLTMGNIHEVIGLKFSSLISSELTWKGVAKGSRSSSRRARNSLCRSWNAGKELVKMDSNTADMPFSETEKLGLSVLGCRFSENADHVPVKKRKLTSRSQSKSCRVLSQHPKENKMPLKNQFEVVNYTSCPSELCQNVDGKNLENASELNVEEDFSGIFILADAACSDGFRGGDDRVKGDSIGQECCADEGSYALAKGAVKGEFNSVKISTQVTGSSISMTHAEELNDLLRTCGAFTSAMLQENSVTNKPTGDYSPAVPEYPLTKKVAETDGMCGSSAQDYRSHWDLNTPMDDWACPLDSPCVDSNISAGAPKDVKFGNYSDKIESSQSEIIQGDPHGSICHSEIRLPYVKPGGIVHDDRSLNKEELKLESGTDVDRTSCSQEKPYSSGYVELVNTDSAAESIEKCKSASAESSTICSQESSKSVFVHQVAGPNSRVDNPLPPKSTQSCDTAAPGVTSAKNEDGSAATTCESVSSGSQVEVVAKLAHPVTCSVSNRHEIQDVKNEDANDAKENSLCQSTEIGCLPCSPIGVEKSTRGVVTLNSRVQHDSVLENDETDNVFDKEIAEHVTKSSEVSMAFLHTSSVACQNNSKDAAITSNRMASEPSDNGCNSDVSSAGHAYVKAIGFELDNDYQYEDGEVRESEYTWQGYDGEDVEAENVSCRSQNVNLGSGSEELMTNMDFHNHPGRLEVKITHSAVSTGVKIHSKPRLEITDSRIHSGMDDRVGAGYDRGWKNTHSEGIGGLGSIGRKLMVESRVFRRYSYSHTREQIFHDLSFRKDRGRYTQHLHSRAQGTDRLFDFRESSRGTLHHHSPKYHGTMSSRRLGAPKSFHHHIRSDSPDARDEDSSTRMHTRPTRNRSPGWRDLGRDRSIRYGLQVQERRPMSRYNGVAASDCDYPLARRETSYSPIKRRRDHHIHRSPLRTSSRCRSHSSSTENPYFRCQSKSSDFGSAIRTQRMRSPDQRPGVFVERWGGFRSALKNHDSPPHNTRWITERKNDAAYFREQSYNRRSPFPVRRSQGRYVHHGGRFDLVDSPRSYRSIHSTRYMEAGGAGGEGV